MTFSKKILLSVVGIAGFGVAALSGWFFFFHEINLRGNKTIPKAQWYGLEYVSKDEKSFCSDLDRDIRILTNSSSDKLIRVLNQPLKNEISLATLDRSMVSADLEEFSYVTWVVLEGIRRHFANSQDGVFPLGLDYIRASIVKATAFDVLQKRKNDACWSFIRERVNLEATINDGMIGDLVEKNKSLEGDASQWRSLVSAKNVVYRYLAILKLPVWCLDAEMTSVISGALRDDYLAIRQLGLLYLDRLSSEKRESLAKEYIEIWETRTFDVNTKRREELLLDLARSKLGHAHK